MDMIRNQRSVYELKNMCFYIYCSCFIFVKHKYVRVKKLYEPLKDTGDWENEYERDGGDIIAFENGYPGLSGLRPLFGRMIQQKG